MPSHETAYNIAYYFVIPLHAAMTWPGTGPAHDELLENIQVTSDGSVCNAFRFARSTVPPTRRREIAKLRSPLYPIKLWTSWSLNNEPFIRTWNKNCNFRDCLDGQVLIVERCGTKTGAGEQGGLPALKENGRISGEILLISLKIQVTFE